MNEYQDVRNIKFMQMLEHDILMSLVDRTHVPNKLLLEMMYYIGELYNKDDGGIENLEGKVSDLEEERDELEDSRDNLRDERDALLEDVVGFTTQVELLENSLSDVDEELDNIKAYIDGFESGTICTRYDEDVDYTEL